MSAYTDLPGRTFTGVYLQDVENLSSAVYQSLGAASVCWDDLSGAGVFDSGRAQAIGAELLDYIHAHYVPRTRPLA